MTGESSMLITKAGKLPEGGRRITRSHMGCDNAYSHAQVGVGGEPVVRTSAQDSVKGRSRVKPEGKLTKRNMKMNRVVFTKDVLRDGEILHYVNNGQKVLEGFKKDGGIFCKHCEKVVSASQFEAHAGYASRKKPYHNIFTSKGLSLHALAIQISNLTPKHNDDLCSICKRGGDMLCCTTCPRAFHTQCLDLSSVPQETWYCKYCQHILEKAKREEQSSNAIAAGRVPGCDPLKEITQRCIGIVETSMPDIGGCGICSGHDFTENKFDDRTMIICGQCEIGYHISCLRVRRVANLQAVPKGEWFCCKKCKSINSSLQKCIEMGDQSIPVVKKTTAEQALDLNYELDIKWRLLKGQGATEANKKFLSDADSIFKDLFDPIADSSTDSVNLIPQLVYGKSFYDQHYGGMHCAILMVNSVVVSAAIFRVFGERVAELPLVATKRDCQGKGYFQLLFDRIVNLLASLGVTSLVLPAAHGAESFWSRFGFSNVDGGEVHDLMKRNQNILVFQETSLLQLDLSLYPQL